MYTKSQIRTLAVLLLAALTFIAAGCKSSGPDTKDPDTEKPKPNDPEPADEQSEEAAQANAQGTGTTSPCVSRVQEAVQALNQWRVPGTTPIRPGIPLPEGKGDKPSSEIVVVASSDSVRITEGFEATIFSADTGEALTDGSYVAEVEAAAIAHLQDLVAHKQEMAVQLGDAEPTVISIAAEPSLPVSALTGILSNIQGSHQLHALVDDPSASPPFERKLVQTVESLIQEGLSADVASEREATVDKIMSRISESCALGAIRKALLERFALPLPREKSLSKPIPMMIEECGCDAVDIDALVAVLHWAYEPQDPGLRGMQIEFGEDAEPSLSWGNWIAKQGK